MHMHIGIHTYTYTYIDILNGYPNLNPDFTTAAAPLSGNLATCSLAGWRLTPVVFSPNTWETQHMYRHIWYNIQCKYKQILHIRRCIMYCVFARVCDICQSSHRTKADLHGCAPNWSRPTPPSSDTAGLRRLAWREPGDRWKASFGAFVIWRYKARIKRA